MEASLEKIQGKYAYSCLVSTVHDKIMNRNFFVVYLPTQRFACTPLPSATTQVLYVT